MVAGVHLVENLFDPAVGIDNERRAFDSHVFAAVHRLFHPYAERFAHLFVRVGEQREAEPLLFAESAVGSCAVGADADDAESHPFQFRLPRAQAPGLERTARSVVFGVEIEDRAAALSGRQASEADRPASWSGSRAQGLPRLICS